MRHGRRQSKRVTIARLKGSRSGFGVRGGLRLRSAGLGTKDQGLSTAPSPQSPDHFTATNMISTLASAPIRPVPTVARAGKSFEKISRYAAFMSWNLLMSVR